ncbi:TPA: hypothetical protein U0E97_002522, partial [Legionella pneumophila]|nr:hypothetical protein [Legionella pneumophila]
GGPWDLTKKTIDLASECGDENLINKLIELHQFDFNNMPIEQASQAVQYNNVRAAELLVNDMIRILSKQDPVAQDEFSDIPAEELPAEFLKQFEEIPDAPEGDEIKEAEVQNPKVVMPPSEKKIKDLLYPLILKAASYGRKEVFDTLCEMWNKNAGDFDKEDLKNFILLAAKGGNSVLLQELIDKYYESNMTLYDKDIQGKVDGIIHELISKGSPDSAVCIEVLLNTLSKEGKSIDDRQRADYISRAFEANKPHMIERFIKGISDEKRLEFLIRAIKKDQPHMVELFIKDLPKGLLNTISLSLPAIEKMNGETLKILEKNGMKFTEMEKAIIAKKSHQPVGLLLSIGVALAKFTDFCKEVLFKNESVTYDKNKFQAFKSQLNSIKTQNSLANNEPVEAQQNDQVAVYRP